MDTWPATEQEIGMEFGNFMQALYDCEALRRNDRVIGEVRATDSAEGEWWPSNDGGGGTADIPRHRPAERTEAV